MQTDIKVGGFMTRSGSNVSGGADGGFGPNDDPSQTKRTSKARHPSSTSLNADLDPLGKKVPQRTIQADKIKISPEQTKYSSVEARTRRSSELAKEVGNVPIPPSEATGNDPNLMSAYQTQNESVAAPNRYKSRHLVVE